MRFLVDECTGPGVATWLSTERHEVFSVYDQAPGITDKQIIKKAFAENWLLITNDKDFGEKVYREKYPHHGIILLRLDDERTSNKITALQRLLNNYTEKLTNRFIVVTEKAIRVATSASGE